MHIVLLENNKFYSKFPSDEVDKDTIYTKCTFLALKKYLLEVRIKTEKSYCRQMWAVVKKIDD